MKQFFKYMLASAFGVLLAGILLILFVLMLVSVKISSLEEDKTVEVKPNSVLHIHLNYPIEERGTTNPLENFDLFTLESNLRPGLDDILKSIHNAQLDDKIKGIFLDVFIIQGGWAQVEEIRNALLAFKESGKFIYAYAEMYTQKAYCLASVADKIYLNPEGYLEFNGLSANVMYLKGALDKLEIKPHVIRHGKYKSAAEPFMSETMSEENRLQLSTLLDNLYQHLLSNISESRNIAINDLDTISQNLLIQNAKDAVKYGLIDSLYYMDQVLASLNYKLEQEHDKKINFITLKKYKNAPEIDKKKYTKTKIAVIYATGEIVTQEGDDDQMGANKIARAIRKARLDSNVKAIVFRVNSPGGSALGSDVMWRELVLAKEAKPLIVSMSNLAASGGYYIACPADTIIAQPTTITGSIGVFGLIFSSQDFFKNKLGINFEKVKTGKFSDLGDPTKPLTAEEEAIIQKEIDRIYTTFAQKVADGRNLSYAEVDSIAQGRVWSGIEAKKIGLVDMLGGINTAIDVAAKMANLENYRLTSLPNKKDFKEEIMKQLMGEAQIYFTKLELGDSYKYYRKIRKMIGRDVIQALYPFDLDIH